MKVVSIDASPKQLSRLRNGHRVRIKEAMAGSGFNLLVDPSKFDAASRCFSKGTAYQIQLTPDELMANKQAVAEGEIEGGNIFSSIKLPSTKSIGRTLSKLGKSAGRELTKVGKSTGRELKKAGKQTVKGIVKAEAAVRKNPTSRAIVKKLVPLIAEKAVQGIAMYAGADPATAKELGKIGSEGTKSGLGEAGYGLYAGRGMYAGSGMCGGLLAGPPSRSPEVSSISVGGNLLARSDSRLPPALQSQAMSANFHMNTQLPPQFQRGGITFR
jgi:hypothetical protein